jgi:hypothetical protein
MDENITLWMKQQKLKKNKISSNKISDAVILQVNSKEHTYIHQGNYAQVDNAWNLNIPKYMHIYEVKHRTLKRSLSKDKSG